MKNNHITAHKHSADHRQEIMHLRKNKRKIK
jgi:hypothetical protein